MFYIRHDFLSEEKYVSETVLCGTEHYCMLWTDAIDTLKS